MKREEAISDRTLQRFFRLYQIEPLGYLLNKLPLSFVWLIFVILYFGILSILHGMVGTPRPIGIGDIFRHPSNYFYYPNLIAISYDLLGNPVLLLLLVFFQKYIPVQLEKLEKNGFVRARPESSRGFDFLNLLCRRRTQKSAIIAFPLIFTLIAVLANIIMFWPQDGPSRYAIFLAGLSTYGKTVVLVQIVYVFIILKSQQLGFELHLKHPDGCGGLAPFGKLALAFYIYIFIYAVMQAIGTTAGGGAFEKTLGSSFRPVALTILWIIFPFLFALIFDQFIYRPHRELKQLKNVYLFNMSKVCTKLHQQLTHNLIEVVERPQGLNANPSASQSSEGLKLIEGISELYNHVEALHTWPIPRRTFAVVGVLANPLIPVLIPIVADIAVRLLR
jgi:hypothetical protein